MAVVIEEGPHELRRIDVYEEYYVEPLEASWNLSMNKINAILVFRDFKTEVIASAICDTTSQSTRDQAEQWLYDLIAVTAVGRPPTETEIKAKEIK